MLSKRWLLFETDEKHPFWLSDNPVVLHNDRTFSPRGNLGLAVIGIQIYLPLSPTLLLGLWCPSHETQLRAEEQSHEAFCAERRASPAYNPLVDETVLRNIGGVQARRELLEAFDRGCPIRSSPANVMFSNSLQVRWAERYVFSSSGDFTLAREMMRDDGRVRGGRRVTIG